ncbi:Sorting nexin-29 [Halotydeus destructor]|nr:Sorting nexin-29 [Halotydeus destructor]
MNQTVERQKLVSNLLEAAKECLARFGGRSELATELDGRVMKLCTAIEDIFSHGLKSNRNLLKATKNAIVKGLTKGMVTSSTSELPSDCVTFWHMIKLFLNKHEVDRFSVLKHVNSDIGRGRAWIRSTLNEKSLERYMLIILEDQNSVNIRFQFYESWAMLADQESSSIMLSATKGLSAVLFAINIDNPQLNYTAEDDMVTSSSMAELSPVVLGTSVATTPAPAVRILVPRAISLGGDADDRDSISSSYSTPATANSSPESRLSAPNGRFMSSGSYSDVSETLDANLLLTPVADDNVSVGEVAISSADVNQYINSASADTVKAEEALDTSGKYDSMTKESEEIERLNATIRILNAKLDELNHKSACQIDGLTKENMVLRIQLKKYISAIALLKQGDYTADREDMDNFEQANNGDFSMTSFSYHQEVSEYEKKLIQVAQMHGELVEFNDRLHRVIQQKEAIIKKLREELIELRGPFPDNRVPDDDTISIASDLCSLVSTTSVTRPLISVWIPTAFMVGQPKSSSHHVYQVYIRIRDEEWNVYRRYNQFYGLHKALKKTYQVVRTFDFPPKKTIGNRDARLVQDRRKRLEYYLRCVINALLTEHNSITDKKSLVNALNFLAENRKPRDDDSVPRSGTDPLIVPATSQADIPQYDGF